MKYNPSQSLRSVLQDEPAMRTLLNKLNQLEQINSIVKAKLDPSLAKHCQVANLRNGILILTTTSPVWNHKLRLISIDLLSQLRKHECLAGIKAIEVKVTYLEEENPELLDLNVELDKPLPIATDNREILATAAAQIGHTGLATALRKLAGK